MLCAAAKRCAAACVRFWLSVSAFAPRALASHAHYITLGVDSPAPGEQPVATVLKRVPKEAHLTPVKVYCA